MMRHSLLDWLAAIAGTETGSAFGSVRQPERASESQRRTLETLYGRFVPGISERATASRVSNPAWRDAVHRMAVAHVHSDGIPLHEVQVPPKRDRRPPSLVHVAENDDNDDEESPSFRSVSDDEEDGDIRGHHSRGQNRLYSPQPRSGMRSGAMRSPFASDTSSSSYGLESK